VCREVRLFLREGYVVVMVGGLRFNKRLDRWEVIGRGWVRRRTGGGGGICGEGVAESFGVDRLGSSLFPGAGWRETGGQHAT